MAGSDDDILPPPPPPLPQTQTLTQQAPHTVLTIKLPILKKGEYDIWAMKMEHYLAHTDYPIWEVKRQWSSKEMWEAIKSRFGGNDESKKMQKYILKQQFEGFSVSNSEGLHKGYDRFQSLLSQLEIHGAGVSTKDANQKFLRVFESDVKGSTVSSSSTQNVAFVSKNTSSTNDVSTAYGVSNSSDHEDLEQLDEFDLEEMDLKWQVAMISMRMKKFYKKNRSKGNQDSRWRDAWNTGNKDKDNGRRSSKQEESKALVTLDGEGVDWTSHSGDEQENYALMAYSSSGSDTEAYTQALKKVEAQLVAHQQNQLWYEEKIRFMKIDLDDKTDVLTYHKKLLAEAEKEKEELKAKVEKWHNSSKSLNILLNSQMSARDKAGLGYGDQMNKGVLSYENEVFGSLFDSRSSDIEDSPVNNRYAEGMHAVPPPMTGIYIPSGPDKEIDDSQFTYGPKQSKPSESDARSSDFTSCESNSSEETHESMPESVVNEPKVVSQPKVWTDAPIIEEYESDSDDEHVSLPSKEQETPSFANTIKHVKTPRQTVKQQNTCSKSPKPDKKDCSGLMSKKLGLGYGFTKKACFVCGSFSHLIRDCDFHEKRMAKQAEVNKRKCKGTGQRENRPVWNNVNRVNHQNQFVPTVVLTRTSKIQVNTARANSTNNVNTVRASSTKDVSTARHNFNSQAVATNAARKVNTVKPIYYLQRALKNKGIVDSGCSRHMTGNKAHLAECQDYNGGPVAFGGSKCYIIGKGKIKTGKLDFEDVCFVKELQHFNLFSVSQICDKKNKVLFTDTGCLMLCPDFKLPDENQVLLRVPRQNNMYSFNLENIVLQRLACLNCKGHYDFSRDFIEFCGSKWIKREYSNARTPQQNGVAERKNMTLIEAARTMLADSFLPNTFWAEAVSTACYVLNRVLVTKPQNKTPYELITGKIPIISYIRPFGCHVTILNTIDHLGKFDGKSDEGFLVGYSLNSKAFRVYNLETKRVEENLHITFLENKPNVAGKGPNWLFDLDYLTDSMNYQPVRSENQANKHAGPKEANHNAGTQDNIDAENSEMEAESAQDYFVLPIWSSYTSTVKSSEAKNEDEKSTKNNDLKTNEKPVDQEDQAVLDELERLKRQENEANDAAKSLRKEFAQNTEDMLLQARAARARSTNTVNTASTLVSTASPSGGLSFTNLTNTDQDDSEIADLEDSYDNPNDGIFTNASYDDEGAVADFTNLETIVNIFLMGRRQLGQNGFYRNKKDERGVMVRNKARLVAQGHRQDEGIEYDEVFAHVARIEAIRIFLAFSSYMGFIVYQMDVKNAFLYGKIDEEVYVSQPLSFVDPKYPKKVYKVVKALYGLHQAPKAWYATLSTFLLKSGYRKGTIDKTLFIKKDKNDIIFMIGSLMYLTAFRPDIMFAVCACSRFQVTPKTSHLNIVTRIFRYLKGKPKVGHWYPRVSSFDLEAYLDSDYAGANLDRKSTTGGCQFLGRRLISWQCKKQIIVATSTTEAEYVATINCCRQVLWIQNQMLDYGFNFMNTKIYINNESTICIVKNPVFHSKTKHIEIRHHFIRDAYEKKLIQVLKIHTNDNVANLLTKAFDVNMFNFLIVNIGMINQYAALVKGRQDDLLYSLYGMLCEQKNLDNGDVFHRIIWVLECN
ncbi:retrovirus-related pol polyprotein from transposon TNT 1-94 [Tanacetum coccineum]|uniref:Retrovirus-related pol polyprotein from transposon TNT 1-94 n=1 Tax=Tanacetum coccineum TaxID=301880 RepID=A0ABQ5B3N6_9ASTR